MVRRLAEGREPEVPGFGQNTALRHFCSVVKTVFAKTRVFKVMKGKRKMKVSILTTAYNHAPYIARALDSFLEQKTRFAFEIIVHDDASEDGTAEIIRQYAERYPTMIKDNLSGEKSIFSGSGYLFIYETADHRGIYRAV